MDSRPPVPATHLRGSATLSLPPPPPPTFSRLSKLVPTRHRLRNARNFRYESPAYPFPPIHSSATTSCRPSISPASVPRPRRSLQSPRPTFSTRTLHAHVGSGRMITRTCPGVTEPSYFLDK